ncbi:mechanosensitive ion channel domain-containing protein [Parazoarcus communis]|uniref:mechanosensitive ion channel domain-containing protein n=1 Tax=Parazoarcus communis TaxID=41977 RepID=UPI000D58E7C1|nr:mechanosensitive ion channel domain-containing protein [Parazoarcus communis]
MNSFLSPSRKLWSVFLITWTGLVLALPAAAQMSVPFMNAPAATAPERQVEAPQKDITVEELDKLRKSVLADIARIDKSPGRQGGAPQGASDKELSDRYNFLKYLAFSYQQHINALNDRVEQEKQRQQIESRIQLWQGFSDPPPYSILLVDRLRAELQNNLLTLRGQEAQLQIIDGQIENARLLTAKSQVRERQARERMEESRQERDEERMRWQYQLAELEARANAAYLAKLVVERQAVDARRAGDQLEVDLSRRMIEAAEASVSFSETDIRSIRERIAERRDDYLQQLETNSTAREAANKTVADRRAQLNALTRKLADLRGSLYKGRQDLAAEEAKLKKEQEENTGLLRKINPLRAIERSKTESVIKRMKGQVADLDRRVATTEADVATTDHELTLAEARRNNVATSLEMISNQLIGLDIQLAFWEMRYDVALASQGQHPDLRKIYEGSLSLITKLDPVIRHIEAQLKLTLDSINKHERVRHGQIEHMEQKFHQQMLEILTDRQLVYLNGYSELEELRQLVQRGRAEFESVSKGLGLGDKAQQGLSSFVNGARKVWYYELFSIEDTLEVDGRKITGTRSITVAKAFVAVAILVIGYFLIAVLTRWYFRVAVRRMTMDATQARIARKWILALSIVILLLVSLAIVKIPLAAFAFLGGAIAIGVGFGMQTMLKNLISGLMLLIERPFRPGDLVEVGTVLGVVTDINVRSCTIRNVNGIDTLVPNSTFIEQNVTNWTHSSRSVRFAVKVGVAYGTSLQKATALLLELAVNHPQVARTPAPEALFEDFGDNAQLLVLYVWLEISANMPTTRSVLSELRLLIAARFAEHGIVIAFPQRDVHLDASAPLVVQVMPSTETGTDK